MFQLVASVMRQETSLSTTQATSKIALSMIVLSIFDSPNRSWAWIHHPRHTTMRNKPSLPLLSRSPPSLLVAPSFSEGQFLVSCHCGCTADHHYNHFCSKSSIELRVGMVSSPNHHQQYLNHHETSSGCGFVGSLDDPYRRIVSEQ
jgi:hypothetical protein